VAIVSNLLTVIATIVVIFAMNWCLALLAVIIVPGLYLPTRVIGQFRRQLAPRT